MGVHVDEARREDLAFSRYAAAGLKVCKRANSGYCTVLHGHVRNIATSAAAINYGAAFENHVIHASFLSTR